MKKAGRGIRFLVFSLVLVTCVVLIMILSFATRTVFHNQALAMVVSNSRFLLSSLDWAVSPLLARGDTEDIQRLLENFGGEPYIKDLRLLDPHGNIISEIGSGMAADAADLRLDDIFVRRKLMLVKEGKSGYWAAIPVRGLDYSIERGSDVAAVLVLGLDTDAYFSSYRPFLVTSLAISILAILSMGAVLLLFIQRWFFAPLGAFKTAAQRLRSGDYGARVVIDSPAEFADFAESFNRMAQEIASKDSMLEERVSVRTAELQNALTRIEETKDILFQQEKMASIGRLAAGIAHEINNPTAYILSNLTSLSEHFAFLRGLVQAGNGLWRAVKMGRRETVAEAIDLFEQENKRDDANSVLGEVELMTADSRKGAARIRDIVKELRYFAHGDNSPPVPCNVVDIVKSALNIVGNKLKYHCLLEVNLGEMPHVMGVPGRIEQVFVNLFSNASDAIVGNGTIRVRGWTSGEHVIVTIEDTGSGISPEDQTRLFEPFFTTKDVGEGTGLGLSISLGIIQELGGRIDVESVQGQGSKFTVSLPAQPGEQGDAA